MSLLVRNLSKNYGRQIALDHVNLTLSSGIVALLGANGSGKSTLLRILATLIKADDGELNFENLSYNRHEHLLRARIGYLPQDLELSETLTPWRFLRHLAKLRRTQVEPILAKLQLEAIADQPFHKLSDGQRRLVGIAQALLGSPHLLLLDELARGLDVTERERVFRLVGESGRLVIFSTHVPDEIERMAAKTVIVLERGRVLFCGCVEALLAAAVGSVYELTIPAEDHPQIAATMVVSRIVKRDSGIQMRVIGKPEHNAARAVSPSLEDAYLLLTQRQHID